MSGNLREDKKALEALVAELKERVRTLSDNNIETSVRLYKLQADHAALQSRMALAEEERMARCLSCNLYLRYGEPNEEPVVQPGYPPPEIPEIDLDALAAYSERDITPVLHPFPEQLPVHEASNIRTEGVRTGRIPATRIPAPELRPLTATEVMRRYGFEFHELQQPEPSQEEGDEPTLRYSLSLDEFGRRREE